MKRINAIMTVSLTALVLSLLSLLLSLILFFNISGKLNKFMKMQININDEKIETLNDIQDKQKLIMDTIEKYSKENIYE